MQVTENMVQRFFDQQCTAEEADTVVSYLYEHPEEIEKWLGPDWQQAGKEIPVPALYRKEIWKKVRQEISEDGIKKVGYKQFYLPVAAAILLVLCSCWFFTREYSVAPTKELTIQKQVEMELRTNTTTAPLSIHLPDRSLVTLEPASTIQYAKGLTGKERKIILDGNGFFEVEKDASRPFTVIAGNISTTALGTSFRVSENKEGVTVKLYTGKVVVKKTGTDKKWSEPVYLLPGTAMTYSAKQERTTIAGFIPEQKQNRANSINGANRKPVQIAGAEMNFDNTALKEVFTQIEKQYTVQIAYDESVINKHYFTGKVLPTDSVDVLLNVICNMNGLIIKKEGTSRFLISKNQ